MNVDLRIKNKQEFNLILHTGKKIKNLYFILYYKEKKEENSRFGITLVKKFGNAVQRNHYKRIVRDIIRNNYKNFENNYDYIIIIRKDCDTIDYEQMKESLITLIK